MSDYEIIEIHHNKHILKYKGNAIYEIETMLMVSSDPGGDYTYHDKLLISDDKIALYEVCKNENIYTCFVYFNKDSTYNTYEILTITNIHIIQSLIELYELYHHDKPDAELMADILNHVANYRSNLIKTIDEVKLQDFSNVKNAN